ncbi:MAG: hypothetical protein ABI892_17715, partial [Flavobacterium sp.]
EPITRKKTLLDFDGTEITEEIRVNKSIPEFSISAKKSNDENKKILSTKTDLTTYSGSITYGSESQLLEANLNIKSNNKHINYNIVWAG